MTKYIRLWHKEQAHWALLEEEQASLLDKAPYAGGQAYGARLPLADLRLLAPVEPPNIFCVGRNYLAHIRELNAEVPPRPLLFIKPTTTLIGPHANVRLPAAAPDHVDQEGELAVVIGETMRAVPEANALDHVFAYTCANDISARDRQRGEKQWTRAKGFDTFCPVGPHLVSAATLDPNDLLLTTRLNGVIMQQASSATMMRSVAQLLSAISHDFTLLPGTLILTGTPAGVGEGRDPQVFLREGDRLEVEIQGIGRLQNSVLGPMKEPMYE